jgi:2-polyprenyl-3-methyl-5-hydroxy-6-metoxy-1,4-benzoquinol methylase
MLDPQSKAIWLNAQDAEKGHWAYLWQDVNSQGRTALINNEVIKGEFIFQEMVDKFGIKPKTDWSNSKIIDVGCGPLSLVARNKLGKTREGVDPLKYPSSIYEEYESKDFKVHIEPFEELSTKDKFDIVIFYNALQHFADLDAVAKKCKEILKKNGQILLSEYLKVPVNDAHIQYLEAGELDKMFKGVGLHVESFSIPVRLPGYVERPDGSPIDLYMARVTAS